MLYERRNARLSLDPFRPSPSWIKANEELELAKECEAIMQRGLNELAKTRRKEKEKMRMLREVAELFRTNWPMKKVLPECERTTGHG
jgi:hypothetical protein